MADIIGRLDRWAELHLSAEQAASEKLSARLNDITTAAGTEGCGLDLGEPSGVQKEMLGMNEGIANLHQGLTILEARLAPVLRPLDVTSPETLEPSLEPRSKVATAFASASASVTTAHLRVMALVDLLDI